MYVEGMLTYQFLSHPLLEKRQDSSRLVGVRGHVQLTVGKGWTRGHLHFISQAGLASRSSKVRYVFNTLLDRDARPAVGPGRCSDVIDLGIVRHCPAASEVTSRSVHRDQARFRLFNLPNSRREDE